MIINWQLTTSNARIKLRRLYPVFQEPSGSLAANGGCCAPLSRLSVEKRGLREPVGALKALADASRSGRSGRISEEIGASVSLGAPDGIVDTTSRQLYYVLILTTQFGPFRYSFLAHFDMRDWPTYAAKSRRLRMPPFQDVSPCRLRDIDFAVVSGPRPENEGKIASGITPGPDKTYERSSLRESMTASTDAIFSWCSSPRLPSCQLSERSS